MAEQPSDKPINCHSHFNLEDIEVSVDDIGIEEVTISPSGKFICVRTMSKTLIVADFENTTNRREWERQSDLAHVNSSGEHVALKVGKADAAIYKTEEALKKVKEHSFPDGIDFLKWISDDVVAIITTTAVYHWSTAGEEDQVPKKMFDRKDIYLWNGYGIVDYQTDSTYQWLLLIGRHPVKWNNGRIQLHSVEDNESRTMFGLAAAFARFKMDRNQETISTYLCYVFRSFQPLGTSHRQPKGTSNKTNSYCLRVLELQHIPTLYLPAPTFPDDGIHIDLTSTETQNKEDYPVGIQVGLNYEVIYLMTKLGFVYVYLTESGKLLCKERVPERDIFVTAPHDPSSGIIAVNLAGQVLSVSVKKETLLNFIKNTLGLHDVALRLAGRNDLPGAEELKRLDQAPPREHQTPSSDSSSAAGET